MPIGANVASAQKPYISGVPGDDPDYFPGDKYSCSDDENLNPEEEHRQVDAIRARRREVLSESRMREISATTSANENAVGEVIGGAPRLQHLGAAAVP